MDAIPRLGVSRSRGTARSAAATILALAALGLLGGRVLAADTAVSIEGFTYGPGTATISEGDTVTWTNEDSAPHTATADDGSWDTGTLGQGETGSITFDAAGTFPYHCDVHPDMKGTVVVEAAAAEPSEAPAVTTPPTTTAPSGSDGGSVWATPSLVIAALGALAVGIAARQRARTARDPRDT